MRLIAKNRWIGPVAISVIASVSFGSAVAVAQTPGKGNTAREPLEIKLVRSKVTVTGGKETFSSAATAKPGEILQEVATYTNSSNAALTKLEATLPVPANTILIVGSAKPDNAVASTDGKNFFPMPLKRTSKQANGTVTEQVVAMNEYKFLRWRVGSLPAVSSLVFSARFRVLDDAPATVDSVRDSKQ